MKTIGIKLADGSFYPVLEDNSNQEKTLDLTTANNNQTTVMVDLYRSSLCSMEDAEYVDTLQIDNLIEHPNGEPDITFTISIDENKKLSAKIVDKETGSQSKTTITLVSRTEEQRLLTDDYKVSDSQIHSVSELQETPVASKIKKGGGLLAAASALALANQQKEKDETTVTFDTAQNTIIIDSSDLEKPNEENSAVLDNDFETELSSEIIEEPAKESEVIQTDFSEFPETDISDEIDSTFNLVQEKVENTESFEGTIEDTATKDSPTENSFEESFDMENVTTESEPKIEIPEPTVFDNSFLEDSLEEQTFVEDTDLSFDSDFTEEPEQTDTTDFTPNIETTDLNESQDFDTFENFDNLTSFDNLDNENIEESSNNDEDFSSDIPDLTFAQETTDLTSDSETETQTEIFSDEIPTDDFSTDFSEDFSEDFDLPDTTTKKHPENELVETNFSDDFNFDLDNLDDNNDDLLNSELETDSFDNLNFDNEFASNDDSEQMAAVGGISFTGLYDKETELGESSNFEEEEVTHKTKKPVIICIICAIICIIATVIVLFFVPGVFKNKNSTDSTEISETTIEEVLPEIEENEEIPVVEEVIPEANEDEIIIVEKAEEVVPEQPPVVVVEEPKPKITTYKIKWGDTLWDIADTYYKNPWKYKFIAKYNGIRNPDHIISGTYIEIPEEAK
jgi:LysM repeat protein